MGTNQEYNNDRSDTELENQPQRSMSTSSQDICITSSDESIPLPPDRSLPPLTFTSNHNDTNTSGVSIPSRKKVSRSTESLQTNNHDQGAILTRRSARLQGREQKKVPTGEDTQERRDSLGFILDSDSNNSSPEPSKLRSTRRVNTSRGSNFRGRDNEIQKATNRLSELSEENELTISDDQVVVENDLQDFFYSSRESPNFSSGNSPIEDRFGQIEINSGSDNSLEYSEKIIDQYSINPTLQKIHSNNQKVTTSQIPRREKSMQNRSNSNRETAKNGKSTPSALLSRKREPKFKGDRVKLGSDLNEYSCNGSINSTDEVDEVDEVDEICNTTIESIYSTGTKKNEHRQRRTKIPNLVTAIQVPVKKRLSTIPSDRALLMSTHTSKTPMLSDNDLNNSHVSKKCEPKRNLHLTNRRPKSSTSKVGSLSNKNGSETSGSVPEKEYRRTSTGTSSMLQSAPRSKTSAIKTKKKEIKISRAKTVSGRCLSRSNDRTQEVSPNRKKMQHLDNTRVKSDPGTDSSWNRSQIPESIKRKKPAEGNHFLPSTFSARPLEEPNSINDTNLDFSLIASSQKGKTSKSVFIHGKPEDKSWSSQVQKLREFNNQVHSNVLKSNIGSNNNLEKIRIRVVIRKRPMSKKEAAKTDDVDVIYPLQYDDFGRIIVYQAKTRVDLTREVESLPFAFDNIFGEDSNNAQIYNETVRNLIPGVFNGHWASVFAYGQTGSGKTFTMMGSNMTGMKSGKQNKIKQDENWGLYYLAAKDVFELIKNPEYANLTVGASLFEIYGGKLFDLLNDRNPIKCLENHKGKVCFPGLSEHPVADSEHLINLIEAGAMNRSTGTTSANADSSRSHAVLQLSLRKKLRQKANVEHGRLTFIDLAGSERGADTNKACKTTRIEGADINTSLLALKEVIRALATGGSMTHIPFRGSKLTQVLKESFVGENSRTVMVACVAPGMTNCDHTLNTLRYADRVKERNPETGELTTPVVETKNPRENETGGNLQSRPVSATSRRNDMVHVDSELSLENKAPKAMPSSLDKDYSLDDWESQGTLENILTGEENEKEHPTSLTGVASNFSTTCTISDEEGEIDDDSSHQQLSLKVTKQDAAAPLITAHRSFMTQMLTMVKQEMTLVNNTDADRELVDDYLVELEHIQEKQLSMISTLRDALVEYYSAKPDNIKCISDREKDDSGVVFSEESYEDFEDLRSL